MIAAYAATWPALWGFSLARGNGRRVCVRSESPAAAGRRKPLPSRFPLRRGPGGSIRMYDVPFTLRGRDFPANRLTKIGFGLTFLDALITLAISAHISEAGLRPQLPLSVRGLGA